MTNCDKTDLILKKQRPINLQKSWLFATTQRPRGLLVAMLRRFATKLLCHSDLRPQTSIATLSDLHGKEQRSIAMLTFKWVTFSCKIMDAPRFFVKKFAEIEIFHVITSKRLFQGGGQQLSVHTMLHFLPQFNNGMHRNV